MKPTAPASDGRRTSAKPFLLASFVLLLILEALGYAHTRTPSHWSDFRCFYAAGYLLRTDHTHLYDLNRQAQVQSVLVSDPSALLPFYHPPYEAPLFAPFSLLGFRAAYLVYMVFNVVLLVATFFAGRPLFSQRVPWLQPRPGLMLLWFLPIAATITWGQDSILFLLLCTLTLRQLQKGNDLSAGCLLALALFRFQLAIPIALLTAARRGWRFSAAFLATATALVLVCFAMVGKAGMAALLRLLTNASLIQDQGFKTQHLMRMHPTAMANIAGLFYVAGTRHLSPHVAFAIVALASLAVFLWTLVRSRHANDELAFAMTILVTILVSYHFLPYDLALLIFPLALLGDRIPSIFLWLFYVGPLLLDLTLGGRSLFLLAVPIFALLVYAGTSGRILSERNDTPHVAPL